MTKEPAAPTPDGESCSNNHRTVQAYEGYARTYAEVVPTQPSGLDEEALRRMVAMVAPGGCVLEVGSGPGWDADYVESLGVAVRRTDVTAAFRELQAERGKQVAALDILQDDPGGPYDGVMALCVLLHIERDAIDSVLRRFADSLRVDGVVLLSIREGEGESWDGSSGDYRVVLWREDAFRMHLTAAGFHVDWSARSKSREGPWLTFIARKR
ncbi:MAG: class I SAM-dependent methyltransferase [Dokdonella sp.]